MPKRNTKSQVPRKRLVKEEEVEKNEYRPSLFREGASILFVCLGIFLLVAIYSYLGAPSSQLSIPSSNAMGRIGYFIALFLVERLGYCAFAVVICSFIMSYLTWRQDNESEKLSPERIAALVLFGLILVLSTATLSSTLFRYDGGGYIGTSIAVELDLLINKAGTILLTVSAILISLGVIIELRISHYLKAMKLLWSGAQIAAKDTSHALKLGAKAGSVCLKKVPSILPYSSSHLTDFEEDFEEDEELPQLTRISSKVKGKALQSKKKSKQANTTSKWRLGNALVQEVEEDDFEEDEEYEEDDFEDECKDLDEDEDGEVEYEEDEEEDSIDEIAPLISRGHRAQKVKTAKRVLGKLKIKNEEEGKKKIYSRVQRKYEDYEIPPRDLLVGLEGSSLDGPDDDELLQNSRKLEQALKNFKLGGKVVEVHPGPIVTLYQFEPAAGIKVQRIVNLADDLALALKVESVRVYAPVPGKGTIGIEVPNAEREIVRLRDIVDSDEFQNKPHALSLALGKDTYGNSFVADLAKMPHLLIAGATGTGKSVCINSLIMSLLYRNSPDDLRLILIDPKMLELSIYESIPHLLSPVVTNPKRARGVLYWAVEEMERRYSLMKNLGVRDLAVFNRAVTEGGGHPRSPSNQAKKKDSLITLEEKDVVSTTAAKAIVERNGSGDSGSVSKSIDLEPMPRIVIVVDELADLMLTVGREIEELLTRLAQKARAAGIHLILATQRPSVNVITGLIKANFPARVSFKVVSKIDSRTVLDQSGSECLLGQGDMLFMSPIVGRLKRLHSPFVSDQEVHDVVSWIREQGEPDYDPEIERVLRVMEESEGKVGLDGEDADDYDPLYDQAVNLVLEKGQASTSMVQRVFRIGYNRAARILETMEREGVVGPADGAKPRQVLAGSMQ